MDSAGLCHITTSLKLLNNIIKRHVSHNRQRCHVRIASPQIEKARSFYQAHVGEKLRQTAFLKERLEPTISGSFIRRFVTFDRNVDAVIMESNQTYKKQNSKLPVKALTVHTLYHAP